EGRVRQGFDGGDDHGQVLRLASGHDRVHRDPLDGGLALPRRQDRDDLARIAVGEAQELADVLLPGRDDGGAGRPTALLVEAGDGGIGAVEAERLGRGAERAHAFVTAASTTSTARSAFFTTSSSRMPPSGCGMSASGSASRPRFLASSLASCSNSSVPMTTVGIPCCSNTMAPWILHDVPDPQSPLPPRTKSPVLTSPR